MGIIIRQAVSSSILSYAGVALGFLNVAILMNRWFTPDELGLRNVLLDIAIIYSQFAHLGVFRSVVKFFPLFKREDNKDNGLLSIALLISLLGFLGFGILVLLFKNWILESYNDSSTLFIDYFWAIFPLSFLMLYNYLLESYLQARSKTIFTTFLKNVFTRLVTTILLILFYFKWIDFYNFIVLFIASYALNISALLIHLKLNDELQFRIERTFFVKRLRGVFYSYSFYSILSSFSAILVTRIDSVMVGYFLGLTSVAIYSNAMFVSILVSVPSAAIGKISLPILSKNWKERKLNEIAVIYYKTSINQFLIGGSFFILIWSNIDSFFQLQRDIYAQGKYVFLILGLSRIIHMLFGVNGEIINITRYYKFDTISSSILAVVTVVSNMIMIPIYGIEGAAIATLVSMLLFNISRSYYVYYRFGFQPFKLKTLVLFFILLSGFFIGTYLPLIDFYIIDVIYRSAIISIVIFILAIMFNISEDLNRIFYKHAAKLKLF